MDLISRALLAAVFSTLSSTAVAQSPSDYAARYHECPAGGLAYWMGTPRALPPPADAPDSIIIDPASIALEVRWAGDEDWIDPPAVPEQVLSDPKTWIRPASVREEHEAIRRNAGADFPAAPQSVSLFQRTEHWAWHSESTVAVRFPDGTWQVDYVQRYDDGTVRRDQRTLDSEASRRMDELVSDPCLAREPFASEFAYITSSDNTRWTLEVDDGSVTTRIAGRDSGFGRAGAIVYLLRGGTSF